MTGSVGAGGERAETRRLVFGDDGSPDADVAWLWINSHPWPGWRIDVMTGAEPPYLPSTWGRPADPEEWEPPWGRAYLGAADVVDVTWRRAELDPRILLDEQSDADLVVVGHAGSGRLRSRWLGSTTEWLLHHPSAPLGVIRSAALVRRVLCCADGSPSAVRALDALLSLPLAKSADVTVLSVEDGRIDADAAIATAADRLDGAQIDARVERARGEPTRVILERVRLDPPELVVLGTKGLTGWRRLRLGSTATAVVHQATSNALVACSDEG